MIDITNAQASASILRYVAEERLTQGKWHSAKDGRDIACLLGAIHKDVTSPADCNGRMMPLWMAELTVTLFDGLPEDRIYPTAKRYGELVAYFDRLSDQWSGILNRVLIRCIDDAVNAARPVSEGKPYWPAVEVACKQCKAAINGNGDLAAASAASAARAARAARAAAAEAWAAEAGEAEAWAAEAWAAVAAVAGVAGVAVRAVRAAAVAGVAGAAVRAVGAAVRAAGAAGAAYDKLFTFLLDEIEKAVS